MQPEKISLYYKDGKSDKVYHAQLEKVTELFVVNFQYGRRGSALTNGTKTASPVAYELAKKIYDKLVQEKTSKGYSTGEEGTPFAGTDKAGQVSGLVPQLLNHIDETEVLKLLHDPEWIMQEKIDGVRLMARVINEEVTASNRRGLIVPLPKPVEDALIYFSAKESLTVDGELVGDTYFVFDLLDASGSDFRLQGFETRLKMLNKIFEYEHRNVLVVPGFVYPEAKVRQFLALKNARAEGAVFKLRSSLYVPGRPNSGGNQVKHKFKAGATCVVLEQNGSKRSVMLAVLDTRFAPKFFTRIGNVTIPANHPIPQEGDYVEVEYLYAFPGGSLFQPVYKGVRKDKDRADEYSTLKFKIGKIDDEEGAA